MHVSLHVYVLLMRFIWFCFIFFFSILMCLFASCFLKIEVGCRVLCVGGEEVLVGDDRTKILIRIYYMKTIYFQLKT